MENIGFPSHGSESACIKNLFVSDPINTIWSRKVLVLNIVSIAFAAQMAREGRESSHSYSSDVAHDGKWSP